MTISNLPSRGLRLGLALLALAVALVSPGCTDDRGSTVPDGTIDGSDIVDDTSRNEAVSCDPSNSTFDLVHHPPSMDQSQYGLPPEEPAARSVPAGASSLDTIGAAISEGTLLIELNDVYPAIQLEITLRSSGSMPFPLTHTMHGAFGMPPTSESFSQYSSLLEQDGDISHRTGIRTSSGGAVELTACPEVSGEGVAGTFDIDYELPVGGTARIVGEFEAVVVESDGSINCPDRCP